MNCYQSYQDEELLLLLNKSDKDAFTEIYNRYWAELFGIAYNRLQQAVTAEDVVHDVFLSLWKNRSAQNILQLENYLATATKYCVLAKIKKLHQQKSFSNRIQNTIQQPQLEESLDYKRVLEIIKTEVERLPEKCKLIFKSSREDGKPVKQIAAELNLSPKTVENQITKALKQLRLATKTVLQSFL